MTDITISQATLADHQQLTQLFEQYRHFYNKPADLKAASEFIKARLSEHDSTILIAKQGDNYCGFVQLYPCFSSTAMQKMYILNDLFVAQQFRRLKVASKLMAAATQFGKDNQAFSLKLCTAIDNHNAKTLYDQMGYKLISNFDHYQLLL